MKNVMRFIGELCLTVIALVGGCASLFMLLYAMFEY